MGDSSTEGSSTGKPRVTFRPIASREAAIADPESLFGILPKSPTVQHLWVHQAELLRNYHEEHLDTGNVALELPTGAGKTLVGLLIAEFRRRVLGQRVAYLCPTRQLAQQVATLSQQYGIPSSLLLPPNYDGINSYTQANTIGICTYHGLFNNAPRIQDARTVILDDAHSAENAILNPWSVSILRSESADVFDQIVNILGPLLDGNAGSDLLNSGEAVGQTPLVNMLPGPSTALIVEAIRDFLDNVLLGSWGSNGNWRYAWENTRDHLYACHLYFSRREILIRPLVPPTSSHSPFADASQRLYMSATLGDGGELERITGVRSISRLRVPKGWDRQASGRRLFVFPDLATDVGQENEAFIAKALSKSGRGLVLVPRKSAAEQTKKLLSAELGATFAIMGGGQIDEELRSFVREDNAALVLANRYDGIDLPGNDCRLLAMVGAPKGVNLQEMFLIDKLGMGSVFRGRLRTRFVQGAGRCCRSGDDYAVVIAAGQELLDFCLRSENQASLRPELRAEIMLGIENSEGRSQEDLLDLIALCLDQGEDWRHYNQMVIEEREKLSVEPDPITQQLQSLVAMEVEYSDALWIGDFSRATQKAIQIADSITHVELVVYSAWWRYLAACSAWHLGREMNDPSMLAAALDHVGRAANFSKVGWFRRASLAFANQPADEVELDDSLVETEALERILDQLEQTGYAGQRFEKKLLEFTSNLMNNESGPFERGLTQLGSYLGFNADRPDIAAAPDSVWRLGRKLAIAFEAKSNESADHGISMNTVREALTHADWVRSKWSLDESVEVFTVIVTPRSTLDALAEGHTANLYYMPIEEIRELGDRIKGVLRRVRVQAPQSNQGMRIDHLRNELEAANLALGEVILLLRGQRLDSLPIQ